MPKSRNRNVITLTLDPETVKRADRMVEVMNYNGLGTNRSRLIEEIVKKGLAEYERRCTR